MKAAPPITDFVVSDDFKVVITFEGMAPRVVDLKTFNLLGPKAKRLGNDLKYLKSFVLADGVPEWDGLALLGPEDLLEASAPHQDYEVASSFKDKVKAKYDIT